MHKIIFVLSIMAALFCGCVAARSETTNASLKFYIVSEQKIGGGKYIDTSELPKLGYIAMQPDLVVTNIKNVWRDKTAGSSIMIGTNGSQTVLTNKVSPLLTVRLRSEDEKKFANLTSNAVGKRLLIVLDEKPLLAPKVDETLNGGFAIELNESDLTRAEDELKKLIR